MRGLTANLDNIGISAGWKDRRDALVSTSGLKSLPFFNKVILELFHGISKYFEPSTECC